MFWKYAGNDVASGGVADEQINFKMDEQTEVVNKEALGEVAMTRISDSVVLRTFAEAPPSPGFAKRLFDIVGAITIGILLSPLILLVALAIRLSGSPVFFSHTRVGLEHQPFRCYKFRTMVPDATERLKELLHSSPEALREWRENHKLKDDPRITKLGAFLRTSSIDELPQLWNVLKGDMSLVGPRPVVADELERYGNKVGFYCSVRPGMTGLWQVTGRSNVTYSRRVSLDVLYVRKQSLFLDIRILGRTVIAVLNKIGAY